ncbi:hypothetical protein A3J78_02285, partial [Candidatus Beckwithbacteria bacterium RBG_13_35_6]
MRYLGIDFGPKNIGLAISEGFLAEPFGFIKVKAENLLLLELKKICLVKKIDAVILGLPEGSLQKRVKDFALRLKETLGVNIYLQDETLTTQESYNKMREAGIKIRKRKAHRHVFSACLILQSYL